MIDKNCIICGKFKQLSEFHKQRLGRNGLSGRCKDCKREYDRNYYRTHNSKRVRRGIAYWKTPKGKESDKKSKLKRKYGLTLDEHKQMYIDQNGCCAVCGIPIAYHKIVTDHCHKTDRVRGLLCQRCNILLAGIDDEGFMKIAIEYIKESKR